MGLKSIGLKSQGLKCPVTQKFMVEKLRVEMSFNPYKEGQKILHDISIKMAIEQAQSGFMIKGLGI